MNLLHPFLQFLSHDVRISTFQHHGNAPYAFTLSIFCHGTETLGRAETNDTDIIDMYRNPVTIGYDYLFNIL